MLLTQDIISQLVSSLSRPCFPLNNEKRLQKEISRYLTDECGLIHEREYKLSENDVIDFFFQGGIGMEVKIKGQRKSIIRQCKRYAAHDEVKALIVASSVALWVPSEIDDKPLYLLNLSRAWL